MPLALLLAGQVSGTASAEWTGSVYLDADGDGQRDPGEAPLPGVLVSNGREVVTSDADGRYALPEREGFVALTRPAGFEAARWYANGSADFGLTRVAQPDSFFSVRVSNMGRGVL